MLPVVISLAKGVECVLQPHPHILTPCMMIHQAGKARKIGLVIRLCFGSGAGGLSCDFIRILIEIVGISG